MSTAFVAKMATAEMPKVRVHVTRLSMLRLLFLLPCCDCLLLLRDALRLKLRWLVIDLAELELDRPSVEDVLVSCRDVLELVLICACRR